MIRVLIISLFALLVCSCKTIKIDDIPTTNYQAKKDVITNTYFATIGEEHIFRANVTVFKNDLSGLMVVKRINDSLHRVVLTSDFGNTLFDFSIYPDKYVANYVMKDIDKKFILNILAKDFQLFTAIQLPVDQMIVKENQIVYLGDYQRLKTVIIWDTTFNRVSRLIYGTPKKAKASYEYLSPEENKSALTIEHYNFPLSIKLTPITDN